MNKKCSSDEDEVCDICIHFQMFKTIDGGNIDGSGYCGLYRKETDAADGDKCPGFYCKRKWRNDFKLVKVGE